MRHLSFFLFFFIFSSVMADMYLASEMDMPCDDCGTPTHRYKWVIGSPIGFTDDGYHATDSYVCPSCPYTRVFSLCDGKGVFCSHCNEVICSVCGHKTSSQEKTCSNCSKKYDPTKSTHLCETLDTSMCCNQHIILSYDSNTPESSSELEKAQKSIKSQFFDHLKNCSASNIHRGHPDDPVYGGKRFVPAPGGGWYCLDELDPDGNPTYYPNLPCPADPENPDFPDLDPDEPDPDEPDPDEPNPDDPNPDEPNPDVPPSDVEVTIKDGQFSRYYNEFYERLKVIIPDLSILNQSGARPSFVFNLGDENIFFVKVDLLNVSPTVKPYYVILQTLIKSLLSFVFLYLLFLAIIKSLRQW